MQGGGGRGESSSDMAQSREPSAGCMDWVWGQRPGPSPGGSPAWGSSWTLSRDENSSSPSRVSRIREEWPGRAAHGKH